MDNREISDLDSFNRHTSAEHAVAGLFFYQQLDCLVDLAHRVSLDFFERPQLYRDVPTDVVNKLAQLRARYGFQEEFPSAKQRYVIFAGVFGQGEGTAYSALAGSAAPSNSFLGLRDQLLAAAAAFAHYVFDTSADMMRARARIMHVFLKDYLDDVRGASVRWSREVGFPTITENISYAILRDRQIAARFAVNKAPEAAWPYVNDANGSKLVEQITTAIPGPSQVISRGAFGGKQQIALRGAEALATIVDFDADRDADQVDLLITKCYLWYSAQACLLGPPSTGAPLPSVASSLPPPGPVTPRPPDVETPMLGHRSVYAWPPGVSPGMSCTAAWEQCNPM